MTKTKLRISLLLVLLVVVIIGFAYAIYYFEADDTKDGTLVKSLAPVEYAYHSWEADL